MVSKTEWDIRYLNLAKEISTWSLDPSTKVGAVIVNKKNKIVGYGFNKFPDEIGHEPEKYADREFKYKHIVHAEEWAVRSVSFAAELEGATVYTNFPVCDQCVEFLSEYRVARLVSFPINTAGKTKEWIEEWKSRLLRSFELSEKHGIDQICIMPGAV